MVGRETMNLEVEKMVEDSASPAQSFKEL